MARHTRSLLTLAAGCSAACVFSVAALGGEPLLRGPSVESAEKPAKMVERNLDGSMRRPEIPVAEKALELISLDDATRSAIDVLLTTRASLMDAIVKENLEALNTMRTERRAGGPEVRRGHMRVLAEMFEPVLKDGPLEKQIAGVLPEAQRETYLGLIREHREMMIAERRARGPRGAGGGRGVGGPAGDPMLFDDEPPPSDAEDAPRVGRRGLGAPDAAPGEKGRRGPGRRGEGRPGAGEPGDGPGRMMARVQSLRLEIQRSVERVTGERRDRMDSLIAALDLTPEQEAKVTAILRERGQNARDAEDKRAARREMMRTLTAELTPEQRVKLREFLGGPNRGDRRDRGPRRQEKPGSGG